MNFTFLGCSFTAGEGLDFEKADPGNYANIVAKYYSASIKNNSKIGNSNYNIFMDACDELVSRPADVLIVQWSGLNRHWVYPGPNAEIYLSLNGMRDFSYRNIRIPKKELDKFARMYFMLQCEYRSMLDLIRYSNILSALCRNKTTLVFLNALVPWNTDLDSQDTVLDLSKKLGTYFKEILNFEKRNIQEVIDAFKELQKRFLTLDQSQWVNIFDPLNDLKIDLGKDGVHPGPKSHQLYADMVINFLNEK